MRFRREPDLPLEAGSSQDCSQRHWSSDYPRLKALFPPGDIDSDEPVTRRPSRWREFQAGLWALRVAVLGQCAMLRAALKRGAFDDTPRRRTLATVPKWCFGDVLS